MPPAVYQQSCEEYLHLGKVPGSYRVDPDGSGPLQPFRVYAVTSAADHCEQHMAYSCRMSRLINTPDGAPFTWWVGQANEAHYYWGGSGPGIQKCACGIERNCTSAKHQCNCDADQRQWCVPTQCEHGGHCSQTWDTFTCNCNAVYQQSCEEYLHLGKVPGSYRVDPDGSGPLQPFRVYAVTSAADHCEQHMAYSCRMSRLINTPDGAPFTWWVGQANEAHYYWGGSGPGIQKCACGIERNCTSAKHQCNCDADQRQCCRVGGRWYTKPPRLWCQAHRGATELPGPSRVRPAGRHSSFYFQDRPPPYGMFLEAWCPPTSYALRLKGASGGQRGFLGCIRALRLNGVTLDLEDRARVTPGVKPGCQGHCDHFGTHCRNGGKCVELYNSYSCDCSDTAYDGRFCTNDVGGYFESGTLVRYDFPTEVGLPAPMEAKSPQSAALRGETNLTREELVFSFSTSNTPGILVYVSSKTQDYLAVVLRHNGERMSCCLCFN
ncbi:hypothetical protein CRUP_031980, partial [Coryphaenoides rupestris]